MEPTVPSRLPPTRVDDYRVRPHAEPKSWAPVEPDEPQVRADHATWIYTHNVERFSRPAERTTPVHEAAAQPQAQTVEMVDVEPDLPPPPRWMIAIAGAAVAALMGALLGGFMHI